MIDLELYRIFYEVAKTGNITQASNNLNISQPAVTKHIKNLEYQLGTTVFIRTRKGVILTETGKKLFLYVKQALELINKGEHEIKNLQKLEKGTLKIGVSTSLTKKYLFKYITLFHKKYPQVTIEISTDPTSQLKEELRDGQIDFILAKMPEYQEHDLEYLELGKLEDVFIVNKDFKELTDKEISLTKLLEYPILLQKRPSSSREFIESFFKENNVKVKSIMNIASSNLLVEFVKIGYGVGVVTKQYVQKELDNQELFIVNVKPKLKIRHFGIIKLKDNILSFSAEAMIKLIKNNHED